MLNCKKHNSSFIWITLFIFLFTSCQDEKNLKSPILFSNYHQDSIPQLESTANWHLKDIEKDKIPGISYHQTLADFSFKFKIDDPIIIAVLDTPLDINNAVINKFLWKNKDELVDGKDNDSNGYSDDIHGWNFLGDTLGSTVSYNNFEYTRIIKENSEFTIDKKVSL